MSVLSGFRLDPNLKLKQANLLHFTYKGRFTFKECN